MAQSSGNEKRMTAAGFEPTTFQLRVRFRITEPTFIKVNLGVKKNCGGTSGSDINDVSKAGLRSCRAIKMYELLYIRLRRYNQIIIMNAEHYSSFLEEKSMLGNFGESKVSL